VTTVTEVDGWTVRLRPEQQWPHLQAATLISANRQRVIHLNKLTEGAAAAVLANPGSYWRSR